MWEWAERVDVCEEVVDEKFEGREGADGFGTEDGLLGEGGKRLGDMVWGGWRGAAARASWGFKPTFLYSFCVSIGRASSPAGSVKSTRDFQSSASSTWDS
jgi:hypothetical protein